MVVFDDKILLLGGKERDKSFSKRVQVLDGRAFRDSTDVPEMLSVRAGAVAASLSFNVIVAGGYGDDKNRVRTVEVFDRRTRMWQKVNDCNQLPTPCAELKGAIADGSRWYLLGGSNQFRHVFTASLQGIVGRSPSESVREATDLGVWTKLTDLVYDFSTVAIFGGSLVAMGGERQKFLGSEFTSNMYVYNNYEKQWVLASQLPVAITKTATLVLENGEMLVIGGRSSAARESDVLYKCKLMYPM
jgi:N-acetylneuraminic acid mutarotase